MNIRNVRDALKLYVGESKDSERQTCVKSGIFCVTFSGWSAGEAQQHKYTLNQITGFLGGVGILVIIDAIQEKDVPHDHPLREPH